MINHLSTHTRHDTPPTAQPRRRARPGLLAALLPLALAALVAACGGQGATDDPVNGATPVNTSVPTRTAGPIVIATDHSVYTPTEAFHVTITNQMSVAIYGFDSQASCSILGLQIEQGSQWIQTTVAHCPLGRATQSVRIAPGATYTATITAGYPGLTSSYFTPGAYRLTLYYSTTSPTGGAITHPLMMYSQTLTVVGPIPTQTAVGAGSTGSKQGTIVAGPPIVITPTSH